MRAVVYTETGPSSVLKVVERDLPEPGPGEVRVRMVRAGVNPTDWKFRAGMMTAYDEVTPGQDGSGVVDARRRRASTGSRSATGSGWCWPSTAGRTAPPPSTPSSRPSTSVPLPDDADFDLGASLGVPAVTAHRALTAARGRAGPARPRRPRREDRAGAGGAGAVGNAAIQLARWAGATVVTTVSSEEKAALARRPERTTS